MLAENKHEHGSSSKLNIASTLRVSVLYQVEPLISYPSAREGLHDRGTSGISVPPYNGHHTTISSPPPRGYTIAPATMLLLLGALSLHGPTRPTGSADTRWPAATAADPEKKSWPSTSINFAGSEACRALRRAKVGRK